ncbi:hypothetical protein VARV_IND64_vel4_178 [Variola virus]|uniref:B4L protein n=2 Tax=Variola virus TaxID=10255 RepID=Q76QZ3_VAR67|nr:hypothetical protein VARVgp172 [Variola virus]AAA60913.1 putative [Variola major virus]AAA69446.1 B4L [Variola virus]ABF23139.1 hypothetical protein VARV_BOT72_143_178 [Variola virus]ABF23341.1 hypothetical protein VARV_BOT73_225_178 [Variola virus]ABF23747.1 hypothetical protein VARV_BSH74_nur_178 [Variola virus]
MYNMSRLIHFSISFSISLMQSCPAMNPITLCVLLSNPMNKYPPSVLAKDESIEGSCCRIRVLSCLAETDVFLILTELPNLTDSPA